MGFGVIYQSRDMRGNKVAYKPSAYAEILSRHNLNIRLGRAVKSVVGIE